MSLLSLSPQHFHDSPRPIHRNGIDVCRPKEQISKTHQTDIHEKINPELSDDWPACGVSKLNCTGMCLFQFKASVPHVCYMFTFRFDSFPVWQRGRAKRGESARIQFHSPKLCRMRSSTSPIESDRVRLSPIAPDCLQYLLAKTVQNAKADQSDRVRQSPIESDCGRLPAISAAKIVQNAKADQPDRVRLSSIVPDRLQDLLSKVAQSARSARVRLSPIAADCSQKG